jgi:hypothetical protein
VSTNGHAAPAAPGRRLSVRGRGISPARVLALVALVALTVLVANSCQKAQVRISQNQAIGTARGQVDFRPTRTQIRLVRQGINSHPFWAVSLSVPKGTGFKELAVIRVDANTGKVASVAVQQPSTAPATP